MQKIILYLLFLIQLTPNLNVNFTVLGAITALRLLGRFTTSGAQTTLGLFA